MQHDQPYARQHPLLHSRHGFIQHLIMRRMAPLQQHVGFIKNGL